MNGTIKQDPSPLRQRPAIYSGMQLPIPRSGALHPNIGDSEYVALLVAVLQALLNCKQINFSGTAASINIPQQEGGVRIEQWSPTPKTPYVADNIVFYQPDGSAGARTFYALQDVPNGISPATGAPYWASFPLGGSGAWL